jgi:hypothetical protein
LFHTCLIYLECTRLRMKISHLYQANVGHACILTENGCYTQLLSCCT